MAWYAIQHKPAQGKRSPENPQNQDARCSYPKVSVDKIREGKRTTGLEPLFPGCLFISIEETDPLWSKLRSTRGVLRVVGFGGKPVSVPDSVIDFISAGLFAIEKQGGLRKGEEVEIQKGPSRGIEGIFQAYEGYAFWKAWQQPRETSRGTSRLHHMARDEQKLLPGWGLDRDWMTGFYDATHCNQIVILFYRRFWNVAGNEGGHGNPELTVSTVPRGIHRGAAEGARKRP